MKPKRYFPLAFLFFTAALILSLTLLEKYAKACIFIGLMGVIAVFFSLFEIQKTSAEKIVLIALLSCVAAVGRVLFTFIPSVQPASFIIIMAGIVFGEEAGFLTGVIAALASNLMMGQGPWTIWQMFAWGMMGAVSSYIGHTLKKSRAGLVVYGFIWGFLFGWIMNIWVVLGGFMGDISRQTILSVYAASFVLDLAHALSNALLIALFGQRFIKIFARIAVKYGLVCQGD